MSLIYPRIVKITRNSTPSSTATPGVVPMGVVAYGGVDPAEEQLIAVGLPASIQFDRVGTAAPANLPTDSKLPMVRIEIPQYAASIGTIERDDIVTDDLGTRYQVTMPYFNSGYALRAQLLAV